MSYKPRTRRVVAWAAFGAASLLIAVPLLFRGRIQEEWLIWRLSGAHEAEQVRLGKRLGALKSVRAIPALLALTPSDWELSWLAEDELLEHFFDKTSGPLEDRSPAVVGLRSFGEVAARPLLAELERFGEAVPEPGDWLGIDDGAPHVRLTRIVGTLARIPEARDGLVSLWESSDDPEVRGIAALTLYWMVDSPEIGEVLKRVAGSRDREWLPEKARERLENSEGDSTRTPSPPR